jgi:8-oxo-dGTP pyrophosphatase MutT (NUDIX family)
MIAEGSASPLTAIELRLRDHRPHKEGGAPVARASVAMVLAESDGEVDLLLIHRAVRDDDPWSGHMAFPGGRRDPDDRDVVHTASRETLEEVGIDLDGEGKVLAHLDELRAVARHRPLDLVITPVVFALARKRDPQPNPREVGGAIWVPLSFFYKPEATGVYRRTLDGVESQYPCYEYQGYQIWGLTYRILEGFLGLLPPPVVPAESDPNVR